ncbi:CCA tRNA nucleotidyltransferase [Paenibacillus lutrae]|uniref:CCA tRNA nucleotidyltransferase n=1 Tax=Paenibacillus lutrae TaxID=2078573 RepID=A0A7X3JZE9_9BACL|nr:CCA tRNA nucleotidyltransferase [Paenibacillus lutrae]MVP00008.1 CCA tRNA nucleotidyltransferase [Paenibacillus lutrae]
MADNLQEMMNEGREVLTELQKAGHQAYFVGGFVRDLTLGRSIKDIDIATSALPEEVIACFRRTVPTGLQHGTVTVIAGKHTFEVTTFRKEGEYEAFRRPSGVEYIDDLQEDLKRRDFTINAMAMNADGTLIDPFGGRQDLAGSLLRCVGEAAERFGEDALRMLRCIRFAAQYGLQIEEATWTALLVQIPLLKHIAMERVRAELQRMIGGADPSRAARLLLASGWWRYAKTPLALPYAAWADETASAAVAHLSTLQEEEDRWAVLLLLIGSQQQEAVRAELRALTFPGEDIARIAHILAVHALLLRGGDAEAAERPEDAAAPEARAARFKRAVLRHGTEAVRGWLRAAGLLHLAWVQREAAGGGQAARAGEAAYPADAGAGSPGSEERSAGSSTELDEHAGTRSRMDIPVHSAGLTGMIEGCNDVTELGLSVQPAPGRDTCDMGGLTEPAAAAALTGEEIAYAAQAAKLGDLFCFIQEGAAEYLLNGERWIADMPVYGVKDLAVGGSELMEAAGRKAGPWLGEVLNSLTERVALGELNNNREALLKAAFPDA